MKTWISFRVLLDSLESDSEFNTLDPISQRMLEWIALRSQNLAPLYIQEIVMKSEVASPATVHKAIALILREGFISVDKDDIDSRRRIVQITAKSESSPIGHPIISARRVIPPRTKASID